MQLFLWPGGALLFVLLLLLLLLLENGRCISGRFWVVGCWWRLNYLHGLTNIFLKNKPISDTNMYTDKQTLRRQTRAGNTRHVARSVSACVPLRLSPYSPTRPVNIRKHETLSIIHVLHTRTLGAYEARPPGTHPCPRIISWDLSSVVRRGNPPPGANEVFARM